MTSENFIGICDEPTTYRDDYRYHESGRPRRGAKKVVFNDGKSVKTLKKVPLYAESYDTLQKLDYQTRLPFNALWRDEKNIDKNYRTILLELTPPVKNTHVSRKKPDELKNLGVNIDDVDDPELRKFVIDFMYKTTKSQCAEEVWRNWKERDVQSPKTISENIEISIAPKSKLIPDLPAGFKGAAKKWDSLQERGLVDYSNFNRIIGDNKKSSLDSEDCVDLCRMKLEGKKLRLPYEKLPSSYGGHRTPLALGVGLEKKKISIHHPDLTVSQVFAMRLSQDG